MAARPKPGQGRKLSVYFSAEQLAMLEERDLTPAEIVRRGFAYQNPVEAPADLQPAFGYIASLAQALASGGRVTYPDRPGEPG